MEINFRWSAVTIALAILFSNIGCAFGEQTGKEYPYQTEGFNADKIKSNPIVIVDKKTLFVPNLLYIAKQRARFLVGTDSPKNSTFILDEAKSTGPLHSYHGLNIYLQLPENWTTSAIDYLALWSLDSKTELGRVVLFPSGGENARKKIPEALGYHKITSDNRPIYRVPKCCVDYACGSNDTHIISYKVYQSNQTHIDPEVFVENAAFIPYNFDLQCPDGQIKLSLEPTEALGLIYNSSLIYIILSGTEHGFLSQGNFCLSVNDEGNGTTPYMCFEDVQEASFPNLYFPFLILSTICFFVSVLCFVFILKAKDVHQKCFVGYTSSMTVTFLCLILLQKLTDHCNVVGSLFFYFILCSVSWLACLCVDLVFLIRPIEQLPDKKRIYYYIGFCLGLPLLCIIISMAPDGRADVPQSFVKDYSEPLCSFSDASLFPLFIPIGLLILVAVGGLAYTSYLIRTKDDATRDYDWVRNKSNRKFMSRSCYLLLVMTCIWLVEAFARVLTMATVLRFAIDLIEASQGIFAMFIFILNKYTRKKILRALRSKRYNYNEWPENVKTEGESMTHNEAPEDDIRLTEMNSEHTPGETSANRNE